MIPTRLNQRVLNGTVVCFDPGYEWPSSCLIDYINSQGFYYTCTLTKRVLRTDLKCAMLVTTTPFLSLESLVLSEVEVGREISTRSYFIRDGFPGSVVMSIMRITGRSV